MQDIYNLNHGHYGFSIDNHTSPSGCALGIGWLSVADQGFYIGGFCKEECAQSMREKFKAMPTFTLTMPILVQRWRVPSCLLRLRAAS